MAKGMNSKKSEKKEATKTPKEKKEEKRAAQHKKVSINTSLNILFLIRFI